MVILANCCCLLPIVYSQLLIPNCLLFVSLIPAMTCVVVVSSEHFRESRNRSVLFCSAFVEWVVAIKRQPVLQHTGPTSSVLQLSVSYKYHWWLEYLWHSSESINSGKSYTITSNTFNTFNKQIGH